MKISTLFCCFLLLFIGVAHGEALLEQVKNNELFLAGNLAILTVEGKQHLVSVGTADINSSNPSLVKRARIMAKVRAQNQLSQFIHDVKIEVAETLESRVRVIEESGELASQQQKEIYLEQIKETNQGALKNITTLGAWIDGHMYFYVLVLSIE